MSQIIFHEPASCWEEALPIGNGRMGAMVFGSGKRERVQLNEDSIWYGGVQQRINPDALPHLEKVRKLILEGKITKAQELLTQAFSGLPENQRPYQTAGDLWIEWEGEGKEKEETGSIERKLNLCSGVVQIVEASGKGKIKKEYLASFPDQVLAIHLKAEGEERLKFTLHLERQEFCDRTGKLGRDGIFLEGNLGEGGSRFCLSAKAAVKDGEGKIEVLGQHLRVEGAKEAFIYLAMETSFYCGDSYKQTALERLEAAAGKGYEKIRARHLADYRELMGRVELKLHDSGEDNGNDSGSDSGKDNGNGGGSDNGEDNGNGGGSDSGEDNGYGSGCGSSKDSDSGSSNGNGEEREALEFAETYFQFGRYLCISSSRPGSQPANLQGIWNCEMAPPWESKYTININTEMNYWLSESCNLSECHRPLFDLLKRMHVRGKEVAEKMYGCRGFMAHHNTDIWADCAPQDIYIPATYWVMGAAWLCTHILTHYRYTLDKEFLQEMYQALKDAVLFFHDYLVEENGELVTCPSVSPENTYILSGNEKGCVCAGASMDIQILRDLFSDYMEASDVLGIQDETTVQTKEMLAKLPAAKIGKYGQIMEWREDYEELEPGHRHISQLYALYPSGQITQEDTPELARAARKTLERRLQYGGGYTGWSCAWITCLYARLGDGDSAWENLKKLWKESTFPNLMNNHPLTLPSGEGYVFQIDGNFGATAAMAEMLLQSRKDKILLLPALPLAWKEGSVKGLVADSGAVVDMKWKDGRLTACRIRAANPVSTMLCWEGWRERICLKKGEIYTWQ